jgi:CMP/dCMP kinase
LIVAIDGVVASGKSAVGRRVAETLGLRFVDSGLFYRALTRLALDRGLDVNDADALTKLARSTEVHVDGDHVEADGEDLTGRLYDNEVGVGVSPLAAVGGVREAMVPQQRRLGAGGVVMAGRDIGTVVFPDADHKFFLTASLEERMRRRAQQYGRRGERADEAAMLRDVAARDRYDTERTVAPLRPASDAAVIDTDGLSLDEVVELLLGHIRERRA